VNYLLLGDNHCVSALAKLRVKRAC
jgi:hypothetical protein